MADASSQIVYMDNHATTRVDPRVVEAMLPFFDQEYGNAASSGHRLGRQARDAVEAARAQVAAAVGAVADEIFFTGSATESNNLAIRGVAEHRRRRGDHLISVRSEHHAVLEPIARLTRQGYSADLLEVEPHGSPRAGWLDPQKVADALRDDTALVSVMLANNEIGVIQPLAEIGAICRERGVLLHCDATQGVGKLPVDVRRLGVDLMSFSAHKLYGPKGVGALYVRGGSPIVRLVPQTIGGGQEKKIRSGTLNVPGIVGLARAVELCIEELPEEMERLAGLRNRLAREIFEQIDDVTLCGPGLDEHDAAGGPLRLPGNLNLAIGGVEGETLQLAMPGLAVSSGAACASSDPGASHVLLVLGLSEQMARSALRFGLGRFNTTENVDFAVQTVVGSVKRLRKLLL